MSKVRSTVMVVTACGLSCSAMGQTTERPQATASPSAAGLVGEVVPAPAPLQAPVSTAFLYQGELRSGGMPADGAFDLRFRLLDDLNNIVAGPICLDNVAVSDGLFTVQLDFGAQFTGEGRQLQIQVKPGGLSGDCDTGTFATLAPNQRLFATPYAEGLALPFQATTDVGPQPFRVDLTSTGTFEAAIRGGHGTAAVWPFADSAGVLGVSSGSSFPVGVAGYAQSGIGVIGYDDAGSGIGVLGRVDGNNGIALRAIALGTDALAASLEGDVDITGVLNYSNGGVMPGRVLTTDAMGNASWQDLPIEGASTSGSGTTPSATTTFLTSTRTVTINEGENIFVSATKAFGSTLAGGASSLDLYIGYRVNGSGDSPTLVGGGMLNMRVPQNTRVPMAVNAVITGLPAGTYDVGMAGDDDGDGNWNSNEFGYVSAIVLP